MWLTSTTPGCSAWTVKASTRVAAAAASAMRFINLLLLKGGDYSLIKVERMALERRERRVLEHILVRRLENHAGRLAGLPGLDPAQHVQAPAVAMLQSAKAQVG